MICSLLIMTIIFINGIENAKQKVKHLDSVWKEEEAEARTKAWLLMVESGKVDEEELRRITPKSIFIAPLLTSQVEKCQDGYRFDHLGRCVKVIKSDPRIQIEFLLKKLNSLYATEAPEGKEKEKEVEEVEMVEGISRPSNGPLQFSIPILNEEEKESKQGQEESKHDPPPLQMVPLPSVANDSVFLREKSPYSNPVPVPVPVSIPVSVPLPLQMLEILNRTIESKSGNRKSMEEIEISGAGPLFNDAEPFLTSGFDESDISSGDYSPEEEITTTNGLFIDEAD